MTQLSNRGEKLFHSGLAAFLFIAVHTVASLSLIEFFKSDSVLGDVFLAPQYPGWVIVEYPIGPWALIHSGYILLVPVANVVIYWLVIFAIWSFVSRRSTVESLGVSNPERNEGPL